MLSFAVYTNGAPAKDVDLSGAYVLGSDDVPLRAEITVSEGVIRCNKRAAGPAGIAILWSIPGCGKILTESVRLQERDEPYILQVELARGRLMRINHKIEDWGLEGVEGAEKPIARVQKAREILVKALQAGSPHEAAKLGEEALGVAVQASEALSQFHAEIFLARRRQTGGFGKRLLGCRANMDQPSDLAKKRMMEAFDVVTLPMSWRDIEPREQAFDWKPLDAWVEMLAKSKVTIKGSPLLSFDERHIPDWLYIWEHDFETIRDLAFEHVRRVINRYGQYVQLWDVMSGIHANCCFSFNFEQLMELTRMSASLTRQIAARSTVIVNLVAPWGEYYARNQRTIPPLLYADMIVQSGVDFDAFGLQFFFGPARDGMFVRDMFQLSSMLDLFAKLGKPVHITAVQVPSAVSGDEAAAAGSGGVWRQPWSEGTQSDWLQQFLAVALSKPFVESFAWHSLADGHESMVPHGGLLRSDLATKPAYDHLLATRKHLLSPAHTKSSTAAQ